MGKQSNLTDFLTDLANAIRRKKGTASKINPQDFAREIAGIETYVPVETETAVIVVQGNDIY